MLNFWQNERAVFPSWEKTPTPKLTRKHPLQNKRTRALQLTAGKIIDFPSFCFDYKKVLRKQTAAIRPSVATRGGVFS